jgi:hypothetical protein
VKIALLFAPLWSREHVPPFGLSLIASYMRGRGHDVMLWDLNTYFFLYSDRNFWVDYFGNISGTDPVFQRRFIDNNRKFFDGVVDRVLDSGAQVIGFSVFYNNELMSLELARAIKARDPRRVVVFGGPQCSRLGGDLLRHPEVDAVVVREGETVFSEFIERLLATGRLPSVPGVWVRDADRQVFAGEADPLMDLNALPNADFADFALKDYLSPNMLPTYMSRGCFKKCVFCDVNMYSRKWRVRSGRRVFDELKQQAAAFPGVDYFYFYDPIINGDLDSLEEFCDLVLEEKRKGAAGPFKTLKWAGNAIIRPDLTPALLKKMKDAGCDHFNYGIESGSQNVVNAMKKGYAIPTGEKVLRMTREAGIGTHIFYMVGFPTETEQDFQDGLDFIRRNADSIRQINPSESFTCIDEGTYLFDHPEQFGVPAGSHSSYWVSQGGANNYLVRLGRFERLCKLAEELGIKLGSGFSKVETFKDEMIKQYEQYRRDEGAVIKT